MEQVTVCHLNDAWKLSHLNAAKLRIATRAAYEGATPGGNTDPSEVYLHILWLCVLILLSIPAHFINKCSHGKDR